MSANDPKRTFNCHRTNMSDFRPSMLKTKHDDRFLDSAELMWINGASAESSGT